MTPEYKVIEKIRNLLTADTTLDGYFKKRVYASHISSVAEPVYPALSIFLLGSRSLFATPGMVEVRLQLDAWLLASTNNMDDIMTIQARIRAILQRANLTDSTVGVKVATCTEVNSGPLIYEQDTDLYHYPTEFLIIGTVE